MTLLGAGTAGPRRPGRRCRPRCAAVRPAWRSPGVDPAALGDRPERVVVGRGDGVCSSSPLTVTSTYSLSSSVRMVWVTWRGFGPAGLRVGGEHGVAGLDLLDRLACCRRRAGPRCRRRSCSAALAGPAYRRPSWSRPWLWPRGLWPARRPRGGPPGRAFGGRLGRGGLLRRRLGRRRCRRLGRLGCLLGAPEDGPGPLEFLEEGDDGLAGPEDRLGDLLRLEDLAPGQRRR